MKHDEILKNKCMKVIMLKISKIKLMNNLDISLEKIVCIMYIKWKNIVFDK